MQVFIFVCKFCETCSERCIWWYQQGPEPLFSKEFKMSGDSIGSEPTGTSQVMSFLSNQQCRKQPVSSHYHLLLAPSLFHSVLTDLLFGRWIAVPKRPGGLGTQEWHFLPTPQPHPHLAESQTITAVNVQQHRGHPWWRHLHTTTGSVLLTGDVWPAPPVAPA